MADHLRSRVLALLFCYLWLTLERRADLAHVMDDAWCWQVNGREVGQDASVLQEELQAASGSVVLKILPSYHEAIQPSQVTDRCPRCHSNRRSRAFTNVKPNGSELTTIFYRYVCLFPAVL